MTPDLIVGLIALTVLFTLEGALPFYPDRARRDRYTHGLRNGTLMLINGAISALLVPLVLGAVALAASHQFGLGRWLAVALADAGWGGPALVTAVVTVVAILAFDLWMYVWHRANHRIPLLWRFHQVHHTDTAMDSTTALRFHPGELVLSTLFNLPVLVLLGLTLNQFVLYKASMLLVILFHHSNVRVPNDWDRRLRAVIVPPSLHRVHHSRIRRETDSNYGTIFSFWDRLFGSFRLRPDVAAIRFGTGHHDSAPWQSPWRLLLLPLQAPAPGRATDEAPPESPPEALAGPSAAPVAEVRQR